ncbi:MAG: glycine-rich domain-containing protein, partial [Candidatus Saccharimonadales bacterium]
MSKIVGLGTATPAQVLEGYTATSGSGANQAGTMPNLGAQTLQPGAAAIGPGYVTSAQAASPGSGSQTFTSSGTLTVPSGVTRLRVLQWGAGGGGLAGYYGGGSGGFAMSLFPVLPGQSASITVGAGGLGGSAPTAGGSTTVAVGSNSVTVGGGGPGTTSAAGSAGNAPTT